MIARDRMPSGTKRVIVLLACQGFLPSSAAHGLIFWLGMRDA